MSELIPGAGLIPAIVGPTASGKSELGIEIALRTRGEIINLDSVQVYRGIQVATAKVPTSLRRGVPHHLIDIVEPTERFTAGAYARLATPLIHEILGRGRTPILVGGTGFYLRAITAPLFEGPDTDPALRERLTRIRDRRGPEHLWRLLKRVDPRSARRISPRDWSRTMRAIEVFFQTGRTISEAQASVPDKPDFADRIRVVALSPPRDLLYSRINLRAERMFQEGLVEEVTELIKGGIPPDAGAFQAHGYRRVVEHLLGHLSREEALNQMMLDTRHYAKRQLTWWRAWPGVKWINRFGDEPGASTEALEHLENEARSLIEV